MIFETKNALIVRNDLAAWQRLNVVAFLATGITAAAPEILGQPYIDSLGRQYGRLAGEPMLVFEASLEALQKAHFKGLERELTLTPYVEAMFATGHDEANREVFRAEDTANLNLVGLAIRGPKKAVDKAIKGLKLHP